MTLTAADFDAYFMAMHGSAPFPWQRRLLDCVVADRAWPGLLDLPTGVGKTAAIDVALFHLALEAQSADRTAPVRVVFVVDRRIVVDQTAARARKIAERLASDAPDHPVLREVARRLALLGGTGVALAVHELRGGIARDDAWARSPTQPTVLVSTVDQVGSRLLFRGYGVSRSMRPIHAGLLGSDALLLLDEVHLSRPFAETLRGIQAYRGAFREKPLPDRWQFVEMSATPAATAQAPFRLDRADEGNATLARRLRGSKPVTLHKVPVAGDQAKRARQWADGIASLALGAVAPGRSIGVVLNRVAAARDVHRALQVALGTAADVELMTGRMRPTDRDDLQSRVVKRAGTGRERASAGPAFVLVATQCIEAGADLDFDVLLTECASLDALRQRFGRLDRLGTLGVAPGLVAIRSDALKDDDDPIYGPALRRTWEFLERSAPLDLGLRALQNPAREELMGLLAPHPAAPVLLPAHLDAWVQTSQEPAADPEVALWLHGDGRAETDVSIVWRADLPAHLDAGSTEEADRLIARVEASPPTSPEAMSVPIHEVCRWLEGRAVGGGLADVDGAVESLDDESAPSAAPRAAIAWRADGARLVGPVREGSGDTDSVIRPGDTLLVPATYGGITSGNWSPSSTDPVGDVATRAMFTSRGRASLRLHPIVLRDLAGPGAWDPEAPWAQPPAPPTADEEQDEPVDEGAARAALKSWLKLVAADESAPALLRSVSASLLVTRWSRVGLLSAGSEAAYDAIVPDRGGLSTEDDEASFTGAEVLLDDHLAGVEAFARRFATGAGLPESLVAALGLAGAWHDAGKSDSRFQRMLHGGDELRARVRKPVAKSARRMTAAERRSAQTRSSYPRGARHELTSVALMARDPSALAEAGADVDLVLHLIASHHGWCRPFAPIAEDPVPVTVRFVAKSGTSVEVSSAHGLERFESGVAGRFLRLVREYGWYGVAWLESLLRLADHRRSEEEQRLKAVT